MARNPDIQRKAQDEVDKVVGTDRLPEMSDRDSLPYVNRIMREALRFAPVAPSSFIVLTKTMYVSFRSQVSD